jgi:hypothetical protein
MRAPLNATRKLVRLHTKIDIEVIAIAGPYYADQYIVGFNKYGSIAQQQADNEGSTSVDSARLVDVVEVANTMADRAGRVAACTVPPKLSSEQ